jgi:superfamily II DNA or RNA helicase
MRTDNWTIMAPHASVGFKQSPQGQLLAKALEKVPGVKKKRGGWLVPGNAVELVATMAQDLGVSMAFAKWEESPSPEATWEEVEKILRESGEVRDWVLNGFLIAYQMNGTAFGWNKSGVHFWHSTGAGKTLTGVLTALSVPGPMLVVTRASARLQFSREIERFTTLRPYVIRPDSEKRGLMTVGGETWVDFFRRRMPELGKAALVADEWKRAKASLGVVVQKGSDLDDYMKECKSLKRRPVLVVGWEALVTHLEKLLEIGVSVVIYDELHQGKGSKRWDVVPLGEPEGVNSGEKLGHIQQWNKDARKQGGFVKEDGAGFKMFLPVMNRAAAAAILARRVNKRIGTTATPIKDRVRDLWSQLDIIEPNAWGAKTKWDNRHTGRKPGIYGGYDNSGKTNSDELNLRLSRVAHILTYAETHSHLPPKRRQSVYIAPEDQCKPSGGFAKERKDAKKRGPSAVLEVGLAEAASRKRSAVLGLVDDHVRAGQKVVLFTGRRRDCDALTKSIKNMSAVKGKKGEAGIQVWGAHGEHSQKLRDQIVQDYMAHPGPCILVGTGHAFGESLNIDDTDAAMFVMLPYTPGQLRQWEGRFHRASSKKPVIIYYIIAESTVDEHMAAILIDKLPAVEEIAKDTELGAAKDVLAGYDENESDEEFAASILADLDFG